VSMLTRRSLAILAAVALITVLMVLSIGFLVQAYSAYIGGYREIALYYFMTGLMGLALSVYTLAQTVLRRPRIPTSKEYKVHTIMHCLRCGFRDLRPFRRGDYVLGPGDNCPRCLTPMVILAIYREGE